MAIHWSQMNRFRDILMRFWSLRAVIVIFTRCELTREADDRGHGHGTNAEGGRQAEMMWMPRLALSLPHKLCIKVCIWSDIEAGICGVGSYLIGNPVLCCTNLVVVLKYIQQTLELASSFNDLLYMYKLGNKIFNPVIWASTTLCRQKKFHFHMIWRQELPRDQK